MTAVIIAVASAVTVSVSRLVINTVGTVAAAENTGRYLDFNFLSQNFHHLKSIISEKCRALDQPITSILSFVITISPFLNSAL